MWIKRLSYPLQTISMGGILKSNVKQGEKLGCRRNLIIRAMNILMLGWELPPHNSGGLGVACYHLSKALAAAGASIDFVLPMMPTTLIPNT